MSVKTVTKPKVRTLDEAVMYMTESIAEMSKEMAKSKAESDAIMAKSKAESDAKMAKSKTESDAKMAKSKAESDAKIAESQVKTDAKIAESDAKIAESQTKLDLALDRLAESQAKTDLAIQKSTENIERLAARVDEVLSGIGTVGNRLGNVVELVVIPGFRRAINEFDHDFTRTIANKKFSFIGRDGLKRELTEVDLFLFNVAKAMAVEIKTTLTAGYVSSHLARLRRMREYEKEIGIQGKKLYGAVAGVYIDKDARKVALKNGLYVVEIQEEEKKLKIGPPAKCHVW